MPPRIKSYVAEDADGDYTVTLNDYLSDEALQRKIKYELTHIGMDLTPFLELDILNDGVSPPPLQEVTEKVGIGRRTHGDGSFV
jgi:hypothetical protein